MNVSAHPIEQGPNFGWIKINFLEKVKGIGLLPP